MTVLKDWLVLIRTPTVGAARLRSLIQEFGDPHSLRAQPESRLRERGLSAGAIRQLKSPDTHVIDADLAWLEHERHHLLTLDHPDYPPQLREIPTPPVALFVIGDPGLLWLPQLAVVGSRHPTTGGIRNAREFAHAVCHQGLAVTSGLALGIDGAAHQAALNAGGRTIAVAATGLDRVYPASHRALASEIAAKGAIVSEYPLGTGPRPGQFPARNRLISGLSLGTLVVEASVRSGSLITARMALEQSREVFAIPGSIHNPLSRGCHRLIQQGAKLVETGDDVIQELAVSVHRLVNELQLQLTPSHQPTVEPERLDPTFAEDDDYQRLLAAVGYDSVSVDTLVESTGLTADAVSSMLLILELSGRVEAAPGGTYCRAGEDGS